MTGDLLEEYRRDRAALGRLRADTRLVRAAASISRAYRREARTPIASPRRPVRTWHNLRLAVRTAGRQPGLTLSIMLPLAFAVTVNTALFSVFDGLLFRPLPFRQADELVAIRLDSPTLPRLDAAKYFRLRDEMPHSALLAEAVHAIPTSPFADAPDAVADLGLRATGVSPGFFALLGASPALGRDLLPSDLSDGRPLPAVVGYDLWRRVWAADPGVVGSVVKLAGREVQVVGVAPRDLDYPRGSNIWVPADSGITTQLRNLARLAPGASIDQLGRAYPDFTFQSLRTAIQPKGAEMLAFLLAATGILLLTAWVQVGGLMLSRASGRAREIGVRLALGATRRQLVGQFAMESGVPAGVALGLAWVAAPWLTDLIAGQLPSAMTLGQHLEPDRRTFVFLAAISALGVILLSVTPLEMMRRANPLMLLRGGVAATGARAERIRSGLLVAQISFSALLLCLAGLALHSFVRVSRIDVGFETTSVWRFAPPAAASAPTREERLEASARRDALVAETLQAVSAHPGVVAAAAVAVPPLSGPITAFLTWPGVDERSGLRTRFNAVTPGFFRTLSLRVVQGRAFDDPEFQHATDVAVVNETLAHLLAASGAVVGRQIQVTSFRGRIIGVVNDVLDETPGVETEPQVFTPSTRSPSVLLARVPGDPARARAALTPILESVWGPFAARRLRPLDADVARVSAPWRSRSILLGLIALLCVPLAAVGLTGALLYTVRTRTREIAIRMALGADAGRVRRSIVGRAMRHVSIGLVVGLAGGMAVGRLMQSQLFGIRAADPGTVAGVTVGLLALAWAAAWLPARRAAGIAPAVALKDP